MQPKESPLAVATPRATTDPDTVRAIEQRRAEAAAAIERQHLERKTRDEAQAPQRVTYRYD